MLNDYMNQSENDDSSDEKDCEIMDSHLSSVF